MATPGRGAEENNQHYGRGNLLSRRFYSQQPGTVTFCKIEEKADYIVTKNKQMNDTNYE